MQIRVATPRDTEDILRLNQEHCEYEEQYTDVFRTDWSYSPRSKKLLAKRFASKSHTIFVATTGKRTVGYAICEIEKTPSRVLSEVLVVHTFFVTADHRNQGVGKALMGAVMKLAKGKGVRRMRVVTLSNNIDAIRFYKKMGLTNFSVGLEAYVL